VKSARTRTRGQVCGARGKIQNAVVAQCSSACYQSSRGSAVRVHCSLERRLCASDDARMHIDRVDSPLDKTALGQGVPRRHGGLNARGGMTALGSRAFRKGPQGRGAYSASLSAALAHAANWGGSSQSIGPAGVLSDTHIVEQGMPGRATACRFC
jgi:hypothetical protein